MPQYQKKYSRQESMHKKNAARSGRDLIVPCMYIREYPDFGDTNPLVKPVVLCDAGVNMFNVYLELVRDESLSSPPLKITICWMNNSTQLVVVYHRHTDVIFQKISCLFLFKIFLVQRDGYTHTHFVMTGMVWYSRRERLPTQPPRRT